MNRALRGAAVASSTRKRVKERPLTLDAAQIDRVNAALLEWYRREARPLQLRERTDPYSVLVVEVMAQQTQIARVDELAMRFFARFPSLAALASAEAADVIDAWRGLGYNRRALALHRAAQQAVALGGLPVTHVELMELPGIGPYTARAVAAIAGVGRSIPVDVNVARVVGRLTGAAEPLSTREAQEAADLFGAALPDGRAGAWAQGAMDLASRICRTSEPRCDECPLRSECRSAGRSFPAAARSPRGGVRFATTRRWLRGRLMDELRDAGSQGVQIVGARGEHDDEAVAATIKALVTEGLAESLGGGAYRLPRSTG